MLLIIQKVVNSYQFLFKDLPDERSKDFFLVGSPFILVCILTSYVYFVTKLGPQLMKNRAAFNLKTVMIIYNAFQIVINAFIFIEAFRLAWGGTYNWLCEPMDWTVTPRNLYICRVCHLYFLIKLFDLLDTVFMVLRKRDDHISFLHVYHHAGMCALAWGGVKYLPGGHGTFVGFINSFVHMIMYSYYLLSLVSPRYAEKIWWKKYLTQLQMAQFLMVALHTALLGFQPNCKYPKFVIFVLVPQNFFMFLLFCEFYKKAYCRGKPQVPVAMNSNNVKKNLKYTE